MGVKQRKKYEEVMLWMEREEKKQRGSLRMKYSRRVSSHAIDLARLQGLTCKGAIGDRPMAKADPVM